MHRQRLILDRLLIELQQLKADKCSHTLVPTIICINSLFVEENNEDSLCRNLKFMVYEIMALAAHLPEAEHCSLLNNYFFNTKGFQCLPLAPRTMGIEYLMLQSTLNNRSGHPLIVALIYCHLANSLKLPIFISSLHFPHLVKWVRGNQNSFINLEKQGELASEQELALVINRKHQFSLRREGESLDILSSLQIVIAYLHLIIECFEVNKDRESLLFLYGILMQADPSNLKILARRSLLYREMGRVKEAIADLKRYFSFVEKNQASPELQIAFSELQQLTERHPFTSMTQFFH